MYVPRFKRSSVQAEDDGGADAVWRQRWDDCKRTINSLINKVNAGNLLEVARELYTDVDVLWLRGPLCKTIMRAQLASFLAEPLKPMAAPLQSFQSRPSMDKSTLSSESAPVEKVPLTKVYGWFVAILNSQTPSVVELLVQRLILAFRKHFRRDEKQACLATSAFLGELMNVGVVDEIVVLELLLLLLENVTPDSLDVAIRLVHVAGPHLHAACPKPTNAVFERLRQILQRESVTKASTIDRRLLFAIEDLFQWRLQAKAPAIALDPSIEALCSHAQAHSIELDDDTFTDRADLNVFYRPESTFDRSNLAILQKVQETTEISNEDTIPARMMEPGKVDLTGKQVGDVRKLIYLTIMSSVDFEECGHKLLRLGIPVGMEGEVCNMIVECCSQERSYLKYYGLLAERFCSLNLVWRELFVGTFQTTWQGIHRLETNKIRNVSRLFAHLLASKALKPEDLLATIVISDATTTSSSRIFLKFILQDWQETVGLVELRKRFATDESLIRLLNPPDSEAAAYTRQFFEAIGLASLYGPS